MSFGMREHELRLEGTPHERLELKAGLTEAELSATLIDYEKKISESCALDPVFTRKVNDLCNNYSLNQLQTVRSLESEELFSARNALERFVSLNMANQSAEHLSEETLKEFSDCAKRLETAILNRKMLETAIAIKSDPI